MRDSIENFKAAFHRSDKWIHLNNAGTAPIPMSTRVELETWVRRFSEEGEHCIRDAWPRAESTRATLGKFLNAKESEVAFFAGASSAISQVAFGLDLQPGDEILAWDQEYPSNLYPWSEVAKRTDAKLVLAKSEGDGLSTPAETLLANVTDKTKVIAFSWVQYRTGAITDIGTITSFARPRGIFTCADVIQGVGQLPFDFAASDLDAACSGTHKWLCSPPSAGYLLLREDRLEEIRPLLVGALSFGTPDDYPTEESLRTQSFKSGARRFEPGSRGLLELLGLRASLDLFMETGMDRVAQEVEWLARKLAHGLRERGYLVHSPHGIHHRGAIVNFSPGPDARYQTPEDVSNRLRASGVSLALRPPGVRVAPHAFNTSEEIDRVLELLDT